MKEPQYKPITGMINVNDIKNGLTVKIDNNIYTVVGIRYSQG